MIKICQIFFQELNIPKPKYYLGVGGGSHGENTGRMIELIEKKITKESPICIVYGDTDSILLPIAATKINIPIAHIEAGSDLIINHQKKLIELLLINALTTFLLHIKFN